MAKYYHENQKTNPVLFTGQMQSLLIQTARNTGAFLNATVHACAMESTHIHILACWSHDRHWKSMRTSIRSALSRAMNTHFKKQEWFSDYASRKRVRDHEHFDYLILEYFPDHHFSFVYEKTKRTAMIRDEQRDQSVRNRKNKG